MAKFVVMQRRISDFEAVVEAENEDEVMDMIADGDIEFDFVASDDEIEIEKING